MTLDLDPRTTALLVMDLQVGILERVPEQRDRHRARRRGRRPPRGR